MDAIALAHHGRVALATEVGVGSTFTLCLPRSGRSFDTDSEPDPGLPSTRGAAGETTWPPPDQHPTTRRP